MSQDFRVFPFKSLEKFDIMGKKNVYRMRWTRHLRVLLCSDVGTHLCSNDIIKISSSKYKHLESTNL